MTCEDEARKLSLDEIMGEYEGHVIWMQVRERVTSWPVKFSHTQEDDAGRTWLCFDSTEKQGDHYYLRPTLMGKTWVMWDRKPSAMKRREAFYHG